MNYAPADMVYIYYIHSFLCHWFCWRHSVTNTFRVDGWVIRNFSISCDIVVKKDEFKYRITVVYGAAYDDKKHDFLDELHKNVLESNEPCLITRLMLSCLT
jgi:hypothetical protein